MKRIISQTFSVSLDQLERLSDVAARTRVSRSSLLREAIDVVLARYEGTTKVHDDSIAVGDRTSKVPARNRP